jgi:hypothetical protein
MPTKITQVILLLALMLGSIVYANQDQLILNDTNVSASIALDFADGDGNADVGIVQGNLQPTSFALLSAGYILFTFSFIIAVGLFKRPLVRAPPLF